MTDSDHSADVREILFKLAADAVLAAQLRTGDVGVDQAEAAIREHFERIISEGKPEKLISKQIKPELTSVGRANFNLGYNTGLDTYEARLRRLRSLAAGNGEGK